MNEFFFPLISLVFLLILVIVFLVFKLKSLYSKLSDLSFQKSSQSVKYGRLTEQWIPFSEKFPYSPENFRFLGNPIDGIVFDEDKIVFTEFKTASSQLSEKQKKIRDQVKNKKVEWLEFKIN